MRTVAVSIAAGCGFVLAAAVLSIPLRTTLQHVPSTLFVFAVMIAAWYGGWMAGLIATATAVIAMDFVLIEPLYTLDPNPAYVPSTIVFAGCAVVVALLSSRRRAAEQELLHLTATLEQRVRQRTEELETVNRSLRREIEARMRAEEAVIQSRDELQRANESLGEFVSMASHDLQEPLRTIAAFSALLKRRFAGQLEGDALNLLASVEAAAMRMRHLLDDLLAYARADGDLDAMSPVELNAILATVRDDLRGAIESSGARIDCDPLPRVSGNGALLAQVFQNLIGNALKYRSEHTPQVRVWAFEEGGQCVICVGDNGAGFDPSQSEHVFRPFKRLHGASVPGTGMGLAICKKIVERHGGQIWADSTPGCGSVFRFTLPRNSAALAQQDVGTAAGMETGAAP